MQIVITILVFVILLSVIVLIHEFGHFYTAIKFGIHAEEFGWGFPPKIWGKKIGKTLFTINLFPIGGFVRLKGEDSTSESSHDKDSYAAQAAWKRALVITAGILLNFVLAITIFQSLIMMSSFKLSAMQTPFDFEYKFVNHRTEVILSTIDSDGQISESSRINKILSIDGQQINSTQQYEQILRDVQSGDTVTISTEDLEGGNISTTEGALASKVIISQVIEGSVAEKAGLLEDDVIVNVGDTNIITIGDLQKVIRASNGEEIEIGYQRGSGEELFGSVLNAEFNEELDNYAIGISMYQQSSLTTSEGIEEGFVVFENPTINFDSPVQKIFAGAILAENMMELQVKGLVSIISTSISTNDLTPIQESVAGPLGIVGITSFAVEQGVFSVLMLAGTLSLIIGMFNLLPIPALDGGRLFFVLVELVSRRKVNANFEKWVHTVGFVVLIFLIVLITYNDILRFIREGSLFVFPEF